MRARRSPPKARWPASVVEPFVIVAWPELVCVLDLMPATNLAAKSAACATP